MHKKSITIQTGCISDEEGFDNYNNSKIKIIESENALNAPKKKIVFNKSPTINSSNTNSNNGNINLHSKIAEAHNAISSYKNDINTNTNFNQTLKKTFIKSNNSNLNPFNEKVIKLINNTNNNKYFKNHNSDKNNNNIIINNFGNDNYSVKTNQINLPTEEIKLTGNQITIDSVKEKNEILNIQDVKNNEKYLNFSPKNNLENSKENTIEKQINNESVNHGKNILSPSFNLLKPRTPNNVTKEMVSIFDKRLGRILNLDDSPHKRKMESFNVDVHELENFIKKHIAETEEKKAIKAKKKLKIRNSNMQKELEKKALIESMQKYQKDNETIKNNGFPYVSKMLDDMKKKVFFMKNVVDYLYPKVIVNKVNNYKDIVRIPQNENLTNNLNRVDKFPLENKNNDNQTVQHNLINNISKYEKNSSLIKSNPENNSNHNAKPERGEINNINSNSLIKTNDILQLNIQNKNETSPDKKKNKSLNNIIQLDPKDYYSMAKYTLPKINIKLSTDNIKKIFKSQNTINLKNNLRSSTEASCNIYNTNQNTYQNDNMRNNKNIFFPEFTNMYLNVNTNNSIKTKNNNIVITEDFPNGNTKLNKFKTQSLNNLNLLINNQNNKNNFHTIDNYKTNEMPIIKSNVYANINTQETAENNFNTAESTNEAFKNDLLRKATMSPKRKDFVSDYLTLKRNKFKVLENSSLKSDSIKNNPILEAFEKIILNGENYSIEENKDVHKIMSLLNFNKDGNEIGINMKNLEELNLDKEKIEMFLFNLNLLNSDDLKKKNVRILSPLKIKNFHKFEMN